MKNVFLQRLMTRVSELYRKRLDNGLCAKCGKPLDRQGFRCTNCNEKKKKNAKLDYQFYIQLGVCPKCHKNKLTGNEKACVECRARDAGFSQRKREQNRSESNKYNNEHNQMRYYRCKEQGICPSCGKPVKDSKYVRCQSCRNKNSERKRITCYREIPLRDRYLYGLCTYCDNEPLEGLKVCQKHYDNILKALDKRLENEMEVFVERMNLAKYPTDTLDNMREKLNLTEDEREIFDLLAKAKTIKEISLEVGLSTRTVDNRIANIRSKMRQIGIVI